MQKIMPPGESLAAFLLMTLFSRTSQFSPQFRLIWVLLISLLMPACATKPDSSATDAIATSAWAKISRLHAGDSAQVLSSPWRHLKLPGKQVNAYSPERVDGRDALHVRSQSAVSIVRYDLRLAPTDQRQIAFSWKVPQLIREADMAVRELDDSPVRLVLAFDGDRSKLSGRNQMLSELARALTGEEMPYATLMYVWCNTRAPGTVVNNPRTDRIRKLVVESGPQGLNQWRNYERDIRADFEKAFGEPAGVLQGVGLMSDTDNTRSDVEAWYGPVRLQGAQPPTSK
jgi:Protein of unknown function (DUF3047)